MGVPFVPVMQSGPIVATFLNAPETRTVSSGSASLRAAHDLEMQALEVARLRAAHEAEVATINQVHQRVMGSLKSPAPVAQSDLANLTAEIQKLTQRINDIERLLLIHDNILKEAKEKEKK